GIGARPFAGERSVGAEFGYWLGHAHWGRGLMAQVVAAYAPWLMEALSLQRLQAAVLDFNLASARVLAKSGFVEEGVLRRAVRQHPRPGRRCVRPARRGRQTPLRRWRPSAGAPDGRTYRRAGPAHCPWQGRGRAEISYRAAFRAPAVPAGASNRPEGRIPWKH